MYNLVPTFLCLIPIFLNISATGPQSKLVVYTSERSANKYHFKYATTDLQEREETGEFVTKGDRLVLVVKGYYSYSIKGAKYLVTYKADENGYRAKTTILPVYLVSVKRIGSAALASLAGGGLG